MKQLIHISTVFILIIGLISCNRVKNKVENINKKAKEKTLKVIEKIHPSFDHDKADTENNKKRFKDFIKVETSQDIKNIFCFADEIGIDSDYMFAFNCNETTSAKIIELHHLTIDTINLDNGFAMQHNFEWWNKDRIKKLQKYSWSNGKQYFKYYWYDTENKKAYFFDFDV